MEKLTGKHVAIILTVLIGIVLVINANKKPILACDCVKAFDEVKWAGSYYNTDKETQRIWNRCMNADKDPLSIRMACEQSKREKMTIYDTY